jgi:crossover junction endodeoxyribonuclease RusA
MIEFVVLGVPQVKGNLRRNQRGGMYDSNPHLAEWRTSLGYEAHRAMQGRHVLDEALRLHLRFVFARPGYHYTATGQLSARGRRAPHPATYPDVDKLARAVLDALTGIVWRDDGRITQLSTAKAWAGRNEEPRCEVAVEPIPFERAQAAARSGSPGSARRSDRTRAASPTTSSSTA